jgi:hypothetical protein
MFAALRAQTEAGFASLRACTFVSVVTAGLPCPVILAVPDTQANAKAVSIIASRFICKISEREMSPQLSSGRKGQAHACD